MSKNVKETDIIQQLALLTSLRNYILLSYHNSIAAGCHMGVQKTYEAVRQKFFWPGMYQHIYNLRSRNLVMLKGHIRTSD
jgi:hypothetical protein